MCEILVIFYYSSIINISIKLSNVILVAFKPSTILYVIIIEIDTEGGDCQNRNELLETINEFSVFIPILLW